jgi:hypothetical protein
MNEIMQQFFHLNPQGKSRPRIVGLSASPAAHKKGEAKTSQRLCNLLINLESRISSPLLWQYELLRVMKEPKISFRSTHLSAAEAHIRETLLTKVKNFIPLLSKWSSSFLSAEAPVLLAALKEMLAVESFDLDEKFINLVRSFTKQERVYVEQSGSDTVGFLLVKRTWIHPFSLPRRCKLN